MDLSYLEVPVGALDTAVDPAVAPPGTLTICDNAQADTPGVYAKRKGYTALAALPTSPLVRLAARGNELLACQRSLLYSYRGPTVDGWTSIGRLPSAQTSQSNVALDQTADITAGSRATANGITVHAYAAGSGKGLIVRCVNAASGAVVATATDNSFATVAFVRCIVVGNYVAIWWTMAGGAQQLRYMRVDATTLAIVAATTYRSGAEVNAATPYFDVFGVDATTCLVAWYSATPNTRVALFNMAGQTTSSGPTVMSADVVDSGIAVASNGAAGTFGMVAYHSVAGGGLRGVVFNALTTVVTVAALTIEAVTAPVGVNCGLVYLPSVARMLVMWDRASSGTTKQRTESAQVTAAGAIPIAAAVMAYSCGLASKPVLDPTSSDTFPVLVNVWCPHSLQQTYFTLRVSIAGSGIPQTVIAQHAYRNAYKSASVTGQLTDTDVYSSTAIAFSAPIAYKFLSTGTARAGWATFTADLGAATNLRNVQALKGTYFAAGRGANYDGLVVREMNFLLYPEISQATPGAVGAGGMDNGTYSYIAVFESSDANGNTDRSTTSIAVSATTVAGAGLGKVTLTLDSLQLTLNGFLGQTGNISIFRTVAAGTTYFFVGTIVMDPTTGAGLATYVDQAHDSTITSNRILYTAGGVLDREPPPASLQYLLHKNRIWGIDSADRKSLFYSGELSPGESPWFSSLQRMRLDSGGDITGIATMDDKLVVYKSDPLIFKIYGSGANALGQSSDLSPALPMNTDAGASDSRSIAAVAAGTMYRNAKGIQLISRGEECSFLGSPVQTYVDAAANVTAAVLLADAREVRFELDTGMKAVYNYGTNRWTTHTNYQGASAIDAIVVGGVYYWATAAGAVYKESSTSWLDPASTFVPMTIEFAWVAAAGRQGLFRARKALLLADRKDPHDITITSSVNYDSVTAPLVSPLTNATMAALPREQIRVSLTSQKVESVRVKVVDAASSGGGATVTGQGYNLRGLAFLAGVKKGAFDKRMVSTAKV